MYNQLVFLHYVQLGFFLGGGTKIPNVKMLGPAKGVIVIILHHVDIICQYQSTKA